MATDLGTRTDLKNALASYMMGRIRTWAFDDVIFECRRSTDKNVQQISEVLYSVYGDFYDHPISITERGWEVLRRVAAFLDSELDVETAPQEAYWPFRDGEQWRANEYRLDGMNLPEYDSVIHARPTHPWWDPPISTAAGFVILAVVGGLMTIPFLLF